MIHYFDRSRTEIDHKCPRRLYWEYYFDGIGLVPIKLNQHLAFGGAVHEALALILTHCQAKDEMPDMFLISSFIMVAKAELRKEFTESKGFQSQTILEESLDGELIQVTDDQSWLIDHYCDLLEGLVIGWCLVRLPAILEQYRVVQVETEERLQLGSWEYRGNHLWTHDEANSVCQRCGVSVKDNKTGPVCVAGNDIVFLSRPDAILERRTDGALVILSFKTVSQVNAMWLENFKTDQQTISEVLPVEARLGREVAGVQIEGLTKGAQAVDWPRGSGHKHHASPLIWGYLTEAGGIDLEWKARWEWIDNAGNPRRLGKGWNRQRIAERYPGGIPEWCAWLYQNENELLRAQFPSPPLISRSANELEEWQEQVKYREIEVHNGLVQLQQDADYIGSGAQRILAHVFPKHTDGCAYDTQYHSKCPCYELCWGSEGNDPLGSGRYKYRVPNHPTEELPHAPPEKGKP